MYLSPNNTKWKKKLVLMCIKSDQIIYICILINKTKQKGFNFPFCNLSWSEASLNLLMIEQGVKKLRTK